MAVNGSDRMLTLRAYARLRELPWSTVQKAAESMRITRDDQGRVDPAVADIELALNTRPRIDTPVPRRRGGPAGASYLRSRADRERTRAKRESLELERECGRWLRREDVEREAFTLARCVRDRLLGIPDRIIAVLCGMEDRAEAHRLLTAEIRQALAELSAAAPDASSTRTATGADARRQRQDARPAVIHRRPEKGVSGDG